MDVRQPVEKARTGAIAGAPHIPLNELKERAKKAISADKKMVLYGSDGNQALRGCQILRIPGFNKCAGLDGGIALWPFGLV